MQTDIDSCSTQHLNKVYQLNDSLDDIDQSVLRHADLFSCAAREQGRLFVPSEDFLAIV